jgi:hypothetical protein
MLTRKKNWGVFILLAVLDSMSCRKIACLMLECAKTLNNSYLTF